MVERSVEMKAQMGAGDLGNIREIKDKLEDKQEYWLGTIFGRARGLSYRANPQDPNTPSIALTGIFEGLPHDPDRALVRATRLFLPASVQGILVAAVRGDKKDAINKAPARGKAVEMAGNEIEVVVEVGIRRNTKTEIGFEYITAYKPRANEIDPLSEMRKSLPAPRREGQRLLEGPAKTTKGKKRK